MLARFNGASRGRQLRIRLDSASSPGRQKFSLPESIIFYIRKNPTSHRVWKNLIQTCKYFYSKNPIVVASHICPGVVTSWKACLDSSWNNIQNSGRISYKLWMAGSLTAFLQESDDAERALRCVPRISKLLPRIYRCDLKHLNLENDSLSYKEFCFLTSSKMVETLKLRYMVIKHDNGSMVEFDDIFIRTPLLKHFS